MLKYMLLWCFTPAVDIPSQQQLPLYNTHFAGLPQMLLKRGNTVCLPTDLHIWEILQETDLIRLIFLCIKGNNKQTCVKNIKLTNVADSAS